MANSEILAKSGIDQVIAQLALEILKNHPSPEQLIFIGIRRRGVHIAKRINNLVKNKIGADIPMGELDINLYRDDWTKSNAKPVIGLSHIPVKIDDKIIILFDDVLFSGRTVRAALEALFDYGRPQKVELLALIDRGHRELPIAADYVGLQLETAKDSRVDVFLEEEDGKDVVLINPRRESGQEEPDSPHG